MCIPSSKSGTCTNTYTRIHMEEELTISLAWLRGLLPVATLPAFFSSSEYFETLAVRSESVESVLLDKHKNKQEMQEIIFILIALNFTSLLFHLIPCRIFINLKNIPSLPIPLSLLKELKNNFLLIILIRRWYKEWYDCLANIQCITTGILSCTNVWNVSPFGLKITAIFFSRAQSTRLFRWQMEVGHRVLRVSFRQESDRIKIQTLKRGFFKHFLPIRIRYLLTISYIIANHNSMVTERNNKNVIIITDLSKNRL